MMCYRDRTYCEASCATTDCSRLITDDVEAAARRAGLPIALSDFRESCGRFTPRDATTGGEASGLPCLGCGLPDVACVCDDGGEDPKPGEGE